LADRGVAAGGGGGEIGIPLSLDYLRGAEAGSEPSGAALSDLDLGSLAFDLGGFDHFGGAFTAFDVGIDAGGFGGRRWRRGRGRGRRVMPRSAAAREEPRGAWAATRLWRLDTNATARLTLSPAHSPNYCLLRQTTRPLGVIERVNGGDRFRTISEEWHSEVCRRAGRLGWHLQFRRTDEAQPILRYHPHTILSGGRLEIAGGPSLVRIRRGRPRRLCI
jgi:hypothetical protein